LKNTKINENENLKKINNKLKLQNDWRINKIIKLIKRKIINWWNW